MDIPKPHPPVKKTEVAPEPPKKQPYVLKPHLNQRPLKDHEGLAEMKKRLQTKSSTAQPNRNTRNAKRSK